MPARSATGLGLILLDDAAGNAPALVQLDSAALRPIPDRLVLYPVAARPGACPLPTRRSHRTPADAPRRLHELVHRLAQFLGVPGGQADFIVRAVQGELQCSVGLTAVAIGRAMDFHF